MDSSMGDQSRRDETLYAVLNRIFEEVCFPDPSSSDAAASLFQRIKVSVSKNGDSVREASRNSARSLICWTRRGSPFRALLVISPFLMESLWKNTALALGV